jgi:hypothetical protein
MGSATIETLPAAPTAPEPIPFHVPSVARRPSGLPLFLHEGQIRKMQDGPSLSTARLLPGPIGPDKVAELHRIAGDADPENQASVRLMERLGMAFGERARNGALDAPSHVPTRDERWARVET